MARGCDIAGLGVLDDGERVGDGLPVRRRRRVGRDGERKRYRDGQCRGEEDAAEEAPGHAGAGGKTATWWASWNRSSASLRTRRSKEMRTIAMRRTGLTS